GDGAPAPRAVADDDAPALGSVPVSPAGGRGRALQRPLHGRDPRPPVERSRQRLPAGGSDRPRRAHARGDAAAQAPRPQAPRPDDRGDRGGATGARAGRGVALAPRAPPAATRATP